MHKTISVKCSSSCFHFRLSVKAQLLSSSENDFGNCWIFRLIVRTLGNGFIKNPMIFSPHCQLFWLLEHQRLLCILSSLSVTWALEVPQGYNATRLDVELAWHFSEAFSKHFYFPKEGDVPWALLLQTKSPILVSVDSLVKSTRNPLKFSVIQISVIIQFRFTNVGINSWILGHRKTDLEICLQTPSLKPNGVGGIDTDRY